MPVTATAKRALRASKRKKSVNDEIRRKLEIALRSAKKSGKKADTKKAVSLADRAAKKKVIHRNRASSLKSSLSKAAAGRVALLRS